MHQSKTTVVVVALVCTTRTEGGGGGVDHQLFFNQSSGVSARYGRYSVWWWVSSAMLDPPPPWCEIKVNKSLFKCQLLSALGHTWSKPTQNLSPLPQKQLYKSAFYLYLKTPKLKPKPEK